MSAGESDAEEKVQQHQQDQNPEFVHRAFSSIAKRYVLTNHCLTLGIDLLWRKKVARVIEASGAATVLDVATGSGDLAATIQETLPDAKVIGADFCAPMLAEAKKRGLQDLIVADGLALPFPDQSFDALTIGYGLRNPGATLVVLDFSLPSNPLLRLPYRFYLHRVLPLIAGILTGNREAYAYLGESIERFPSGEAMLQLIQAIGFSDAQWLPQMGGISSVYVASV